MLWFKFLDYFFMTFHLLLVIFNLSGWIWTKTRRWNLYTLLLTGASWFLLGTFFGIGYCFLTDWHWQVLEKLGHMPGESSYMQYLCIRLLGLHFESRLVDIITLISFLLALIISIVLNLRDNRINRRSKKLSSN